MIGTVSYQEFYLSYFLVFYHKSLRAAFISTVQIQGESEDRKHISLNSTIYRLHTLFLDSGSTLCLGVRKILPEVSQLPC